MRNDTASRANVDRHGLRAVERTRRAGASQETPAPVAARTRLRQVAQDLRRNRQDLAELARGLRTTDPAPENRRLRLDGTALSVQEWDADCADEVPDGHDDLVNLAETFAQADWPADVRAWLGVSSQRVAATRSRKVRPQRSGRPVRFVFRNLTS